MGTVTNKLGYSELKYVRACLKINTQKASELINNLHAIYHTVFGSENKVSVVDSLTHFSLIRIPTLLWQYCAAEVTPLTSVGILVFSK